MGTKPPDRDDTDNPDDTDDDAGERSSSGLTLEDVQAEIRKALGSTTTRPAGRPRTDVDRQLDVRSQVREAVEQLKADEEKNKKEEALTARLAELEKLLPGKEKVTPEAPAAHRGITIRMWGDRK